jgi:methyl-accepting chemotaxis protein
MRQKLTIPYVGIIIILGVIIYLTSSAQMLDLADKTIDKKVSAVNSLGLRYFDTKFPGDWNIKDNKLYKGSVLINLSPEIYSVIDGIGKDTEGYFTIFQGNKRIATNVLKDDGSRAVGTLQNDSKILESVLTNGTPYAGQAMVVNNLSRVYYAPIRDNQGKVIGMWFSGVQKQEVLKNISGFKRSFLIIIVVCLVLAIVIMEFITVKITSNIKRLSEMLTQIEKNNDLTIKTDIQSSDETGTLSKNINNLLSHIASILSEVKTASGSTTNSSEKLAAATEESGASMQEISSSISTITKGASDNANSIEHALSSVNQVTQNAELVSTTSKKLSEESKKVMEEAHSGGTSVQEVLDSVTESSNSSKEVEVVINELGTLSNKIGEIIEIITGISTQTNLLSLNAAIEAARAGEAGKGFSVVAEEIRKLANGSSEAAKDIANLIHDVQEKTQNAIEKMNTGSVKVAKSLEKAKDTSHSIEGIIKSIDNINKQIDEISAYAIKQSEICVQVNKTIENISSNTRTSANSSQQISKSIQEQADMYQDLSSVAMELSQSAYKLNAMVNEFKI